MVARVKELIEGAGDDIAEFRESEAGVALLAACKKRDGPATAKAMVALAKVLEQAVA